MQETIDTMMCREHKRVFSYLNEFEKELDINLESSKKAFQKFKWNLEKHFFVEEKAVFNFYNDISGEEISEIFEIMREHGEILDLIKKIEQNLKDNIIPEIKDLKFILNRHANFEDATLYPLFDLKLNPEQKLEMLKRAKEIIRE